MWTAAEIERLRSLLMQEWDPIGVHHVSDDDEDRERYWDEYDALCQPYSETSRAAATSSGSPSTSPEGGRLISAFTPNQKLIAAPPR
jgi:hypothetical protein